LQYVLKICTTLFFFGWFFGKKKDSKIFFTLLQEFLLLSHAFIDRNFISDGPRFMPLFCTSTTVFSISFIHENLHRRMVLFRLQWQ
jgi:hypothetical protein